MVRYLLFFMAAGLTAGCLWLFPQYQESGADLLTQNWEVHQGKAGRLSIGRDEFSLELEDKEKSVQIFLQLQNQREEWKARLSAEIRVTNVIPREKGSYMARLLLVQSDGKKRQYDVPHQMFQGEGTSDWHRYETVFTIFDWAKSYTVNMQLNRCTGKMEVRNISLKEVREASSYQWAQKTVIGSWGLFFLIFLIGFGRNGRLFVQVGVWISFFTILFMTTMPDALKTEILLVLLARLHQVQVLLGSDAFEVLSRIGHFSCFFLFGACCAVFRPRDGVVYLLGQAGMIAAGTELVQFYIEGRTPMVSGVLIDMAGSLAGILLAKAVLKVIERKRSLQQES